GLSDQRPAGHTNILLSAAFRGSTVISATVRPMTRRPDAQQLRLEVTPIREPEQLRRRRASHAPTKLGPRLALSPGEAADVLGVSRDYFDEHILPELRIIRRGRRILIPLAELERWLDRSAASATVVGRA